MDQCKPAAPAPAPKMSHGGRATIQGHQEAAESGRATMMAVDQHISQQLQAVYQEVVNEPIPERLLQLLQSLERKQGSGS